MTADSATGTAFGADRPATGHAQPRPACDAEWEAMDPPAPSGVAPILSVDGFEGPLDWLVEMARTRKLDLSKLSILALVEAFAAALDAALDRRGQQGVADLARWADWTVLATQLTLLRSQMLLPPGSPEAQRAHDAAAALRRDLAGRAAIQAAADWLERRPQLGRDVFARGRDADAAAGRVHSADITDLLRACLVALRVPEQADAYQLHRAPFWRVADALARIARLLEMRPEGGGLGTFLPRVDGEGAAQALRCRAALASTFLAGLELARSGALGLEQPAPWQDIHVQALA